MKKFFILTSLCTAICLFNISAVFAHPGRTDGREGHKDNKNESGLGTYHFHCKESLAHLHPEDGKCPYPNGYWEETEEAYIQIEKPVIKESKPIIIEQSKPEAVQETPKTPTQITVIINGVVLQTEQPAISINNTTFLPLRAICDSLGATINFESATKTINISKEDKSIKLIIGEKTAFVNGAEIKLEEPAQIINNTTLVPVRFIAESLDLNVSWEPLTSTITITNKTDIQDIAI